MQHYFWTIFFYCEIQYCHLLKVIFIGQYCHYLKTIIGQYIVIVKTIIKGIQDTVKSALVTTPSEYYIS
jgi:hypothetical protein